MTDSSDTHNCQTRIDIRTVDPRNEIVEHLGAMRAFALTLTRNGSAADDLVQDTIIKAWTHFDKFAPGSKLRPWLFTILRNHFYTVRKRAKREVPDPDGVLSKGLAERPAHDGRLALRDVALAFETLPLEQREALMLVGASGFSYEEAAETCGVAIGTIKSRANRGRKQLAQMLALEAHEDVILTDRAHRSVASGERLV